MARKRKNENVTQTEYVAPEGEAAEAADNAQNANAESKPICLVPNCGREAKSRHLCPRCCTAARKAVKDGKTTWAKLQELNLAGAPTHKSFGGEAGVFTKALKNALGEKKD